MSGRYGHVPRTENPFVVLGLERHGKYSDTDVAKAYRRASLRAHPDKPSGSKQAFDRITASYELIRNEERRARFAEFGSRLAPGAGEALGETMDKMVPLVFGLVGGVLWAASYWKSGPLNLQVLIPIIFVGSAPAVSTRSPVLEVLWTSTSGLLVGGGVGSLLYGLAWSFARLLY